MKIVLSPWSSFAMPKYFTKKALVVALQEGAAIEQGTSFTAQRVDKDNRGISMIEQDILITLILGLADHESCSRLRERGHEN